MRSRIALLLLLAAGPFAGALQGEPRAANEFVVIVHPQNPATSLTRRFVSGALLKKVRSWPDGSTVSPVDLVHTSAVRSRFSEEVHSRSLPAVKSYWQQMIFSGRELPPPELPTDDEVIQFVLKYPGAIGYVSAGAATGVVKVVRLE